ncbi:hypothetical protein [Dehalogenimonas etheniformans]|uniref:Rubrerythrin diiron-binding domain-containing protein n=1 Tax=Dehalogenimonas etheniformans TaxID=1536648 RepID=A0A2P5P855_9CHLR|nr:hypothetical protein [Dehalogenimonas etheniformans]PPD58470.1 hypothetical protein JP09_000835 [Dehalogenimonas etheniformans]QNT76765.1 hypothetical protein HX448_08775 [Dehalogenimonas etheniformans]
MDDRGAEKAFPVLCATLDDGIIAPIIMPSDTTFKLIESLAQNEELIGQLYQVYADRLLIRKQFWQSLAVEEKMHAGWLRQLGQMQGDVKVSHRFSIAAVSTYSAYVQKEIELALSGVVQDRQALVTSLYIEESLIEKRFFDAFSGEGQSFKEVLSQLVAETKNHISKIKSQLN